MNKTMRISVTTFDTFQEYLDAESTAEQNLEYEKKGWTEDNFIEKRDEFVASKKQALIDRIKGVFVESDAMRRGTQFHDWVLGDLPIDEFKTKYISVEQDVIQDIPKYWMSEDFVKKARAVVPPFDDRITEYKIEHQFEIECINEPFTIVGKADYVMPLYVGELKTTSWFDFERYLNSWQWRFYLHIFGVEQVKYHVFELSYSNELKKIEEFDFCAYPTLVSDLKGIIQGLYEFAKENNCL
jgi:hypothetical protein